MYLMIAIKNNVFSIDFKISSSHFIIKFQNFMTTVISA